MHQTILTTIFCLGATGALAQDHARHTGHSPDPYAAAMERMHADMMVAPTGNADVDFIRGMIPHHQGAVDMAKIVLERGNDPEVRKLAEQIMASQEQEIAWMKDWLARNGH